MQDCLRVQLDSQKQRKEKQFDVGTQTEFFLAKKAHTA